MIREEEEEVFRGLEESPISFRLSRPHERLSQNAQSDEEPASGGDSVLLSSCQKSRRQPTCKEKGKMKMPEYDTNVGARSDSEIVWSEDGRPDKRLSRPRGPPNRQSKNCADLPAEEPRDAVRIQRIHGASLCVYD